MATLAALTSLIGCTAEVQSAQSAEANLRPFLYVRIPGERQPVERHQTLEYPIEERLRAGNLGEITGGGTMLNPPDITGKSTIDYSGIDIEVDDLDAGRRVLREILPDLGAPAGTQIEFTVDDNRRQDRLTPSGWVLDEPRTDLHPGFDF